MSPSWGGNRGPAMSPNGWVVLGGFWHSRGGVLLPVGGCWDAMVPTPSMTGICNVLLVGRPLSSTIRPIVLIWRVPNVDARSGHVNYPRQVVILFELLERCYSNVFNVGSAALCAFNDQIKVFNAVVAVIAK